MILRCALIVFFATTIRVEATLPCSSKSEYLDDSLWFTETTCVILNLDESHVDTVSDRLNLPSEEEIALLDPTLPYLSAKLLNISNATKILRIHEGHVPRVYLKPTLLEFLVIDSGTEELLIDAVDNRVTTLLEVSANLLNHVPANVNRLKNLTKLYLCGNLIETVHMDQFNGLEKLHTLYLLANHISTISTTNIVLLPSLCVFSASGNQLETLDISHWEIDKLTTLNVRRNKLQFITGLENRFNQLEVLELRENKVNCQWLEDVSKNRTFAGKLVVSKPCDIHSWSELCCEGDETYSGYLEYRRLTNID
ncbi:leucine-rich repeat-containing protein 40-like [Toxorhynchites rutilus septentrionalis]|uniref:leucine-rich repeat-containing protein 40-like n=1 Tax=Toxorhynchites rutilus septentrionalis TaxID=329112 RepID=UPI002478BFCB|nr:leucine-rich repeat-containing protein 40-like [Toxorhynchites rutilus septentrionalis]